MRNFSFWEKVKYDFDNIIAKGTPAMIALLGIVTVVMLLFFSALVLIAHVAPNGAQDNFWQIFWMSLLRTLDSGTMGGDSGYFGLFMFGVTLVGIFILSTLIGILNSGVQEKLEELRKGRSRVIEVNHTVILGWSEQVYTIISELVITNESQKKPSCIVIMGDKDKVEMEDAIRDKVERTGNTRVVCRQGSPADMDDLGIVSLDTSRSIIILSPEKENPDADVIKTILAITNNPGRKSSPYHIVAEIRDPKNMSVAKIVGKEEVELVLVGDVIARIIAQTCRKPSLSIIYTELLDFGGDEIYFKHEPFLVGKTFGESLFVYEDSSVMGIVPKGGIPKLNPPMDTVIQEGDEIIVISEDASAVKLSGLTDYNIKPEKIQRGKTCPPLPEHTLLMGWNWRTPTIINELDNYVGKGSTITLVADFENGEEEITKNCSAKMKNQTIKFIQADTTDRRVLDSLSVDKFDRIIILCYSDKLSVQEADSNTLITLLHLRDILDKTGKPVPIVSEMLDIKNRDLAEIAKVNDFIVSDKLVSLYLTQVSENKALNLVFTDLFDAEGSEIYLKPAGHYVRLGEKVNFYTVLESAKQLGEIAIGYKVATLGNDVKKAYGVITNPDKSDIIEFSEKDRIILLAES